MLGYKCYIHISGSSLHSLNARKCNVFCKLFFSLYFKRPLPVYRFFYAIRLLFLSPLYPTTLLPILCPTLYSFLIALWIDVRIFISSCRYTVLQNNSSRFTLSVANRRSWWCGDWAQHIAWNMQQLGERSCNNLIQFSSLQFISVQALTLHYWQQR